VIIDLKIFKQAILILKTNSFENMIDSLQSLRAHRDLLMDEYTVQMSELKRSLVNFKIHQNRMSERKRHIDEDVIQPWIPLLKKHQQASVYSDVKAATVTRIIGAKKEMEDIEFSTDEHKLRLFSQTKQTKISYDALKKIDVQIFVLETAADIQGFLNMNNYKAGEIADYEIAKYFHLYMKERD
jgi:hypothetical protein